MAEKKIFRAKMRKSIWCEGCGLGNLQQILTRVLIEHVATKLKADPDDPAGLELIKNNIVMVSGIGCTSRMPGHLDANTLHTTHGRSLAFATGIKMARPDLTVVLVAGDGDIFAIGGNHFIHTARRNIDITLIVYDNQSYGMTGAQFSPTSPLGEIGTSAPYGVFEPPFDPVLLAQGAGAPFVAQGAITTSQKHQTQLEGLIKEALDYRGFSFVNVCGTCHTGWGARNKLGDAYRYRKHIEKTTMGLARWRKLAPSEKAKFRPLGLICRQERADLQNSRAYLDVVAKAKKIKPEDALSEIRWRDSDPLVPEKRTSIRFAGSGGQGVITAGEIALKAALQSGQNGVFTKNYGPEARGGEAYSDLIVSQGDIYFPQAKKLDVLLALNQATFEKFKDRVSSDGTIIVNSTEVTETYQDPRVVSSPIGDLHAREVRPPRRDLGINVLALGLVLSYLDLVSKEALESAVMENVGAKNPALNRKALNVGFTEAERLKRMAHADA